MDLLSLLRTLGGLGVVLGILAGALWLVRRYDLRLPGRAIGTRDRRLELVETLPIDGRRMVALLRRDGHEHLVLIAPEGHLILESGVVPDAADRAAADTRRAASEAAAAERQEQRQAATRIAQESFGVLVDRVRSRTAPSMQALKAVLDRATPTTSTPAAEPTHTPAERADAPITKRVRNRRAARPETHFA